MTTLIANADAVPLAVDAKHLAPLLCCSVRTIRKMDLMGKIPRPAQLCSRGKRWSTQEIRNWISAGMPDRATWETLKKGGTRYV